MKYKVLEYDKQMIGEDMLLLPKKGNQYDMTKACHLNNMAALLWKKCEDNPENIIIEKIIDQIADIYIVDRKIVEEDCKRVFECLEVCGLISALKE